MATEGMLELLVESPWISETLQALGSGHMLFLTFAFDQVEPKTLEALQSGTLEPGTLGKILKIGDTDALKRIALFELEKVNILNGYVRFDFRLLLVSPFMRDGMQPDGSGYRCRFRQSA